MSGPRQRRAVRVVLVDPLGATLLLRAVDPTDPHRRSWWHVPGGGREPGEGAAQAARREVAEETGLALLDPGPVIWRRRTRFTFLGEDIDQHEEYFGVEVPAFVPDVTGWTVEERRWMQEFRWWSSDELATTEETVYPEGFAELLATWRRDGRLTPQRR